MHRRPTAVVIAATAPGRRRRCAHRGPAAAPHTRRGPRASRRRSHRAAPGGEGSARTPARLPPTSAADLRLAAAALDVVLAQVEQVALDLRFALAAQILGADRQARRTGRGRTGRWCVSMISPYSIGNASSDPANSSRVSSSGVAQPARCHAAACAAHAVEIVGGDRADQRQTRRRARARLAVRDERLKPLAEDVSGDRGARRREDRREK